MIFDNVPFSIIGLIFLYCFLGGFVFLFPLNCILWKSNPLLRKFNKNLGSLIKGSLVSAIGFGLILTVIIGAGAPTLIIVNKDYTHTEKLAFFNDNKFIGISGSYILNNTNDRLVLKGIGEDRNLYVKINPGEIKKTRKIPEVYFEPIPGKQSVRTTYRRGKRRVVAGASTYLVKAEDYGD